MRRLIGIVLALGTGTLSANAWEIRSYLEAAPDICDESAVELQLRGGNLESTHVVEFRDGVHDEEWLLAPGPGVYQVELYRVDCEGVRTRVATLTTSVSNRDLRKQLYVGAVAKNRAIDPRYLEIDTYSTSPPGIEARREGPNLILSNRNKTELVLCQQSEVDRVLDEFLIDGEWTSHMGTVWSIPSGMSTIEPGSERAMHRAGIQMYVPPGERDWASPDGARIRLAVRPSQPNHVVLGKLPTGFLGLPGCDFIYISRTTTEYDRVLMFEVEEP